MRWNSRYLGRLDGTKGPYHKFDSAGTEWVTVRESSSLILKRNGSIKNSQFPLCN